MRLTPDGKGSRSKPVRTSPSTAIRLAFFSLFVLSVLMAAWLVWLLRQETEVPQE